MRTWWGSFWRALLVIAVVALDAAGKELWPVSGGFIAGVGAAIIGIWWFEQVQRKA